MLPIIQREIVDNKKWFNEEEFLDAIAVTNSLPGLLATNCATFVGYRVAGFAGAISAVLGAVLPSFSIILVIAIFFDSIKENPIVEYILSGVRPAVVALITYALVKLVKSMGVNLLNISISLAVLISILLLHFHPIATIVICGSLGFLLYGKEEKA
jgi:chromate transporter